MNKLRKLLAASLTSVLLFSGSIASAASFKDVQEQHFAKDEIEFLVEQDLVDDSKAFHPNKLITRSQAAVWIAKALKLKTGNAKSTFKDVGKKNSDYKEIAAVVDAGIFPKEKNFKPNEPMTRKEVAAVLVKAFNLKNQGNLQFKDVPSSSKWYDSITILAENDIAAGDGDGNFKPNQKVTRAEFAVYMARSLNKDFLPTQYTIPMNVNPVVKLFDYIIKYPEKVPTLFTTSKNIGLENVRVKNLEVHELNEVGRLKGAVEFNLKLTIELNGKEKSLLKSGYNELYFLVVKDDYMDNKIQSVSLKPHLQKDDSILFTLKDARSLFIESQKAYWTVVRGGDGVRNESTFIKNKLEYRYMAESLETKEKYDTFMSTVYTPEKSSQLYKQLGLITHNGKLAQPNADGGSILNWEKSFIKQTTNSTTVKKYELKVPIGESKEIDWLVGELRYVPGQGWRVHSLEDK